MVSFTCASRGHGDKCGKRPLFEHTDGEQELCYCECHDEGR